MRRKTIALLIVLLGQVGALTAGPFLPYEGRLTDATGTPVPDGNYDIRFRLYTSPDQDAGEICVDHLPNSCWWEENQPVQTEGGFFTAQLGLVEPFPQGMFNYDDLWLGVRVSAKKCDTSGTPCEIDEECGTGEACIWVDDSEMTPRQQLGGVPYAQREISESVVLLGVWRAAFEQHPAPPPTCPTPDTYSIDLTWTEPPDLLEVLIVGTAGYGGFTPYVVDGTTEVACENIDSYPMTVNTVAYRGRYQIIPSNASSVVCIGGSEDRLAVQEGAMPTNWYSDGFELRIDGCSYEHTGSLRVLVYGHYDRKFDTTPYIPPGGGR